MPQLGESVAEGTVTKWLVREGDYVTRDQTLLLVSTDKADTEVPAPVSGVVVKLAVPVDSVVATRGLLCTIDETAQNTEAKAEAKAPAKAPEVRVAPASGETAHATAAAHPSTAPAPLTSPSTRKLAHEMGVDLSRVQPTGERGRVTRDDLVRAVGQPSAPSEEARATTATPAAVELSQLIQAGGGFVPPIPG
ncbi:MAG: biotin/lipoyl-containing protein, partial [Byssovorax sp.]